MLFGEEKREYQKNWFKAKRQKFINLLGGKCVECSVSDNLHFHHKNKHEKEFSINAILSYNDEFILKELQKCELLCEKCHKDKHKLRIIHGTSTSYSYGCRCDECKKANTLKRAEYRARTGKR